MPDIGEFMGEGSLWLTVGSVIAEDNLWSTVGLFLLAVLIPAAAYFATKYIARKARGTTKGPGIEILERMYLSRDKYILIVKVGEKGYILGVTNQNITALGMLSEQEMSAYNEQPKPASNAGGGGFAQTLKNFMNAPETLRRNREQYRRSDGNFNGDADRSEFYPDGPSYTEADRSNKDGK